MHLPISYIIKFIYGVSIHIDHKSICLNFTLLYKLIFTNMT